MTRASISFYICPGLLSGCGDSGVPSERGSGSTFEGSTGSTSTTSNPAAEPSCLVAQFAGRNRFKIIAAGEVAKLHNHLHAISEIEDLEAPETDATRFPGLAEVAVHEVTLAPGEILYLPLAWWYQVRAEEFGITATYTTFRWPNDFSRSYPAR